jgi:hypothetical protein
MWVDVRRHALALHPRHLMQHGLEDRRMRGTRRIQRGCTNRADKGQAREQVFQAAL